MRLLKILQNLRKQQVTIQNEREATNTAHKPCHVERIQQTVQRHNEVQQRKREVICVHLNNSPKSNNTIDPSMHDAWMDR